MSKLIAFSGGCLSGKTTTMNALKEELEKRGKNVKLLSEFIREYVTKPIDELRKNAAEYFSVQLTIIGEKMQQEIIASQDTSDTIYLIDRALTDSLFYYEHYVETSRLSDVQLKEYYDFWGKLHDSVTKSIYNGYSLIIQFSPIDDAKSNNDKFRPKSINQSKYFEALSIYRLNKYYVGTYGANGIQMLTVDYNRDDTADVIDLLTDKICEL